MIRDIGVVVCVLSLTLVFDEAAITSPDSCREAKEQYQSAKSDVSDALHAYATCVSDNKGHDDCSSEFSTLQSAQSDFESAVSEHESECE
jgi:hypothetical protein